MQFIQRDKSVVWHPFTSQKNSGAPIHIERAEGVWLFASDGRRYIDAISSWWVTLHGHAHPYIAAAIARQASQLEQVIFAGFTHTPAIELAERLVEVLPKGFSRIFYSDNGSTAVEVGLKMALQYWCNLGEKRRTKIIALENAYHGDTFGAMATGARSAFTTPFQSLLFDVVHLPVPHENTIENSKEQLQRLAKSGDVAAFIFEPLVQGAAGMQMYEEKYLDELISIAKEHAVICIADEVMTGFGRTGRLFASDYLTQIPDIICLSKGITGGFMPMGATVCTSAIYQAYNSEEASKTFFHGHSYTANPLACAAALASLDLLRQPHCTEQIERISRQHAGFVNSLKGDPFVKDIRQKGTIMAVELNTPEESSYFNSIKKDLYNHCLEQGVLLRPLGNILYCLPPYCIEMDEMDRVYKAICSAIDLVKAKYKGQVQAGAR
jgi:adenosylmethionine-8-amino-7-oxononanoate aminotransferase